jgi:hypothetical protein
VTYLEEKKEQVIGSSPQVLFNLLGNPERAPEWDRRVEAVTKLSEGPVGRGSRYAETHRILMRENTIEFVIAEYEPPRVVALSTVAGGPAFTTRFELVPVAGGTLLQLAVSGQVSGFLSLVSPLLRRVLRRQLPRILGQVSNYCASQLGTHG